MPSGLNIGLVVLAFIASAFTISGIAVTAVLLTGFGDPEEPESPTNSGTRYPERCNGLPAERPYADDSPCCVTDEHGLFLSPNATCDSQFGMAGYKEGDVPVDPPRPHESSSASAG